MLCSWGCGQEATYKFKNGKCCCNKNPTKCPEIERKRSLSLKGRLPWNKGKPGRKYSIEDREKQSKMAKEKGFGLWMKGKHPTEETRKKLRDVKIGHFVSEETKLKIGRKNKGRRNSEESKEKMRKSREGHTHIEETKRKIADGNRNKIISEETRKKSSVSMKKYYLTPEGIKNKEKQRQRMLNGGVMKTFKNNKNPSKPQLKLYNIVKEIYPSAELDFWEDRARRRIDIVIESLMIAIEYDGSYWHKDKEADDKRQKSLEDLGWKFIRYVDYIPTKEKIKNDINRLV